MSRFLLGAAGLNALLLLPLWIRHDAWSPWLAADGWCLMALAALLPGTLIGRIGRWMLAAMIAVTWLTMLADTALRLSLGRSLNLLLDWPLLDALYRLLAGNLGKFAALAILALSVISIGLLVLGLRYLLGHYRVSRPWLLGMAGVALLAMVAGWLERPLPRVTSPMANTLVVQVQRMAETWQARSEFQATLDAEASTARVLTRLADKNVILVFIESYGMATLEDERFAAVVVPGLRESGERLDAAGLSVVSGRLTSPIQGGQSWLAHATALSGRWIDNQLVYQLLLDSDHATLVDDFRATGHETLAVMPAITLAWPEGRAYGFDRIYAADDLDYAGPALNWVTMPDQFTLDRFQRDIRGSLDGPMFAKLALISSHAPWTPVLPVIDWDDVGDGEIFARWADSGESPEELWQTMERVREQYARAIDYAVSATLHWAAVNVDEDTLVIVMGDHQSSPMIVGDEADTEVPVHVISGDESLTRPFRERGFVTGMLPDTDGSAARMAHLRTWLHDAFSRDSTPEETSP
ncbi:sulfatase-like hydrolase/transferase [Aidingimonas lacisalsi]|uniref:sulfatase-like hydrolase/transferase n=1 Tax=Aidingimonas lacisalsi TaxID=2604086 RepID=UPI0011D193C6|nr:sulfatase-like hydrolase/transferase [Aidingimonas lacisalsi]